MRASLCNLTLATNHRSSEYEFTIAEVRLSHSALGRLVGRTFRY